VAEKQPAVPCPILVIKVRTVLAAIMGMFVSLPSAHERPTTSGAMLSGSLTSRRKHGDLQRQIGNWPSFAANKER